MREREATLVGGALPTHQELPERVEWIVIALPHKAVPVGEGIAKLVGKLQGLLVRLKVSAKESDGIAKKGIAHSIRQGEIVSVFSA